MKKLKSAVDHTITAVFFFAIVAAVFYAASKQNDADFSAVKNYCELKQYSELKLK